MDGNDDESVVFSFVNINRVFISIYVCLTICIISEIHIDRVTDSWTDGQTSLEY